MSILEQHLEDILTTEIDVGKILKERSTEIPDRRIIPERFYKENVGADYESYVARQLKIKVWDSTTEEILKRLLEDAIEGKTTLKKILTSEPTVPLAILDDTGKISISMEVTKEIFHEIAVHVASSRQLFESLLEEIGNTDHIGEASDAWSVVLHIERFLREKFGSQLKKVLGLHTD